MVTHEGDLCRKWRGGVSQCSVFFQVMAHRVQPQEETEKVLRQTRPRICPGAGNGTHCSPQRATWERPSTMQEAEGAGWKSLGHSLESFHRKGKAGQRNR